MADLLLEVGTEELPAGYVVLALKWLAQSAAKTLEDLRLSHGQIHTWGTPRRIAVMAEDVAERQPDLDKEIIGPPEAVAFEADGSPTKAALGFARTHGVSVEDLRVIDTPRGRYVAARKTQRGNPAMELLAAEIPSWITQIPFPKSMRWGELSLRFARPIHWILALWDNQVLPLKLDSLESGSTTWGHRFMSPRQATVERPKDYLELCRSLHVIVDPWERRQIIAREAAKAASSVGGRLVEDPGLLDTVVHLVEFPVVVLGRFQPEFLELPREVLVTAMREHQKFFSVEDEKGNLLPCFVSVANMRPASMEIITRGNERVLRARLSDARFFFQEDRKRPLRERVENLSGMIFHAKLGTLKEKADRVKALAGWLAETMEPQWRPMVEKAALLCKADLTTEMVGEFPTLQGVMGRYYAILDGEEKEVAQAIQDHYLPAFSGDRLPSGPVGAMVALADKLDTLVGCFAVGDIPSGSGDPLGVRRAAVGILRILMEMGYRADVGLLVRRALLLVERHTGKLSEELVEDILCFLRVRLENLLVSRGHSQSAVDAVLCTGLSDLPQLLARLEALERFMEEDGFEDLALSFKRVMNIVGDYKPGEPDVSLLALPEERDILELVSWAEKHIARRMSKGELLEAFHDLAAQRWRVDKFFEAVLINDPDPKVRGNRLSLLARLANTFLMLADFSKLSGRERSRTVSKPGSLCQTTGQDASLTA